MPVKSKQVIWLYLFVLGFSAIFFQIYLLREFMTLFNGNELVIGIILANWMLLTGLGAYLGRFYSRIKGPENFLVFLMLLFSILPVLTILKLDLWHAIAIPAGSMTGLTQIIRSSLLIQVPFCLLNGFLFSALSCLFSGTGSKDPGGRSYAAEAAGSVAAGLVVNLILLWFTDHFTSLEILLWLNLAAAAVFSWSFTARRTFFPVLAVAVILAAAPLFFNAGKMTAGLLFPGQEIAYDHSSPYGKVTVTRNAGQLNFYENGLLLFSSGNEILNEEMVHFAMIQNPHPEKVLLIGGGITGPIPEILKYHPLLVDYCELNPAIIDAGKVFSLLPGGKNLHVMNRDGRQLVRSSKEKYDVALISLPEPSTLQINRFYTLEFFRELKKNMNPGSVVSLGLPVTADYVSPVAARLNSVIHATLQKVFAHVLILPGQKNYYLASDSALHTDVATMVMQKGIETIYVNPYYFDDQLLNDRSRFIESRLLPDTPLNRDFRPAAFFYQLQYWTSFFRTGYLLLFAVIVVVMILVALSLNPVSQGLFTAGLTGSSLQILAILAFQVIYGYVFSAIGILIALFMAGLFAGSWFRKKQYPDASVNLFLHLQLALSFFCIGFPFIIIAMNVPGIPDVVIRIVFSVLIISAGFLTGLEFSMAAGLRKQEYSKVISENYSADLFGSALGAIITSIVLLPFLGLIGASLVIALLNILSAGFLFIRRKKTVTL